MSQARMVPAFNGLPPIGFSKVERAPHRAPFARRVAGGSLALLALALAMPALAQIEEIVVTTRKKDERLKEIPVAVEAITAEEIQRKGITDIARLAEQSASIKFDQGSSRGDTRLSIRGLSPTRGRQNAAILVDGIDISSESISTSGGSILLNQRLLSVQNVEIIKGPQSALWGRSAFNGAVLFVTKDPPDEFEAATSVDLNVEDQYTVSGELGGPIFGEKLGVFINGAWWDREGFYDNTLTGENVGRDDGYGFAVKTKSDFGGGLTLELRGSYEHYEQGQAPEAYVGANSIIQEPAGAFAPNPDFAGAIQDSALFCLNERLNAIQPGSGIEGQLLNQTLIDRYTRQSFDPSNPAIGDGPHCQRGITAYTGAIPDGDDLSVRLATNPYTPGQDYEGLDGDTGRITAIAGWELEKGTFTWSLGYTHDENTEAIDFARYGIANSANPFRDDNVNVFQSNSDKLTEQFTQELRYATNFDGPANITMGITLWNEDVDNKSRSLTTQSAGSYCFYSVNALDDVPGSFPFNPACPGYTELPVQQFVGPGGISFTSPNPGDPVYNGIQEFTRDSPTGRETDHRSLFAQIDLDLTENTNLSLEGRLNHEELEVTGPIFWRTDATGGPGSWSICGVPGRQCDATTLANGAFLNFNNFQDTYDVYQGIWRTDQTGPPPSASGTKNVNLFQVRDPIVSPNGLLAPECADDPNVAAYEAAVDAEIADAAADNREAEDPQFDLFNPYCVGSLERTDDWFAPKVTLSHKITADALLYGSWAHSEKPGGYALFTVGSAGLREDLAAFRPEQMDTWEVGSKTTLLDGTLYVEGALFFNDYTDKQVLVQGLGPDGRPVSRIDNAPAEVLGLELNAQWAPEGTFLGGSWRLGGGYLFIDGEYKDYTDIATSENNIALAGNCTPATLTDDDPSTLDRPACLISFDGNKLERSPKHSVVGNVSYTVPMGDVLDGFVELGGQWKSKQYVEYSNENWLNSYAVFDLRLGLRHERWDVTGYVENLLDDDSIRSATNQPGLGCCFALGVAVDLSGTLGSLGSTAEVPNARAALLAPPRVVGMRAAYRFGGE